MLVQHYYYIYLNKCGETNIYLLAVDSTASIVLGADPATGLVENQA
jgi:hypothetical protein